MIEMKSSEIEEMLATARIGRLAMADATGRPYVIPLPFCWADGALYLRLPLKGRKGEVLRENRQVCFEVDAFTDDLSDYGSVLIEGELIAVEQIQEKARVKAVNDRKYNLLRGGYRPGHGRSTPLVELPMQKIVPQHVSGRRKETVRETAGA
jgi:nitroimidazol reductase NimA-like FMN-containing flavoprotein (pyridoxamine 5'-phosphate oxidase superfamily)